MAGVPVPTTVNRQPEGVRATARTLAPSTIVASLVSATAAANRPRPPRTEANTGVPTGSAGAVRARTRYAPSNSERSSDMIGISCGTVARRDMASARPAYTPPSSGSTSRSTISRPTRAPT